MSLTQFMWKVRKTVDNVYIFIQRLESTIMPWHQWEVWQRNLKLGKVSVLIYCVWGYNETYYQKYPGSNLRFGKQFEREIQLSINICATFLLRNSIKFSSQEIKMKKRMARKIHSNLNGVCLNLWQEKYRKGLPKVVGRKLREASSIKAKKENWCSGTSSGSKKRK